ncbi:MAG: Phosphate-import permease protein PhnE [Chloroflexi bacterium]|nr:Phosphate-import permease protein PhnE [Chloroflexota bacterium]
MNTNSLQHTPSKKRSPSLVPPYLAAILSALIPGLGQALARAMRRGIILLSSFVTILGLMAWRIRLAARRDTEVFAIIKKAYHLQPVLVVLSVMVLILYLWIIYDAYIIAKDAERTPVLLFFMLIAVFFMLGWQIGEIDPIAFVTKADDAAPALARVLWPWEKAISYPEEHLLATVDIQVPCTEEDPPPPAPEKIEGEPYFWATPTCGDLKTQDGIPGTILTIRGENFAPDTKVNILWEDPIGNEFRQRQEGEYVTTIPDAKGEFEVEIEMPYRLLPPHADADFYIWDLKAKQLATVGQAEPSMELKLAVEKIVETIFIGMMATFFGILLALPLSFFAARNLMSASPITIAIYYLVRGVLNIVRSIEPLIWAIIAVIVVGLGPFAGILALTVHSIAALAKLYSESIESIDPGPIEAIQATGANWLQTVMYAVIPQIIPPFVSFTIYRWDINIRMSTIIGFVGGGGIGFLLAQWIRLLDYDSAGIAVWFIAVTVAILDYVSAEIRERFV